MKFLNIFFSVFFLSQILWADNKTKSVTPSSSTNSKSVPEAKKESKSSSTSVKTNILDFEEDVIEGERAAPSLFVQMDIQAPKMETLMFQRKNFNDFHNVDKLRKPKYRSYDIKGK